MTTFSTEEESRGEDEAGYDQAENEFGRQRGGANRECWTSEPFGDGLRVETRGVAKLDRIKGVVAWFGGHKGKPVSD